MSYLLFEIWSEDEIGHQDLVDTTASKTEAFAIAEQCLGEGFVAAIVYQEDETGESKLIRRFEGG
jgi:hypothetical protein